MVLLRRVIGDALRARRQGQHRTLREVSTAANVSLGYLSEIERGQKEASSELLARSATPSAPAVRGAARGQRHAGARRADGGRAGRLVDAVTSRRRRRARSAVGADRRSRRPGQGRRCRLPGPPRGRAARAKAPVRQVASDGKVVGFRRQTSPLKATLQRPGSTSPVPRDRERRARGVSPDSRRFRRRVR